MKLSHLAGMAAVGLFFGAATSLSNDLSSAYGTLGAPVAGSWLSWLAGLVSNVVGHGWSWAAFAVIIGWAGRTGARGAIYATLALLCATATCYMTDSVLTSSVFDDSDGAAGWYEGFSGDEWIFWSAASLISGPALGAVGAFMRRPGIVGLLAGLSLPVGATLGTFVPLSGEIFVPEGIVLPPNPRLWQASALVWVVSAALIASVIVRYVRWLRGSDANTGSTAT